MKILVGMSGGVDSTFAAYKLMKEGHHVEGAVLIMHEYTETDSALAAAESVGIPIHTVDARAEFEKSVIPDFISEYSRARTPNPCIICNSEVKFRKLLDYALENGFDAIATGHYANIIKVGERFAVALAADKGKDQSYMLWRLSQDILAKTVFPLGNMTKARIREEARAAGIVSADRRDSQEICFIPDGDYASYIEARTGAFARGNFVDRGGAVLGEHKGIINYTVGQRKGLGIAMGARIFVTDIDPVKNEVTLDFEPRYKSELDVCGIVFSGMREQAVREDYRLKVKIRYQAPPVDCRVRLLPGGRARVTLDTPAKSVTAGQSAVFYDGGAVLFGGFID